MRKKRYGPQLLKELGQLARVAAAYPGRSFTREQYLGSFPSKQVQRNLEHFCKKGFLSQSGTGENPTLTITAAGRKVLTELRRQQILARLKAVRRLRQELNREKEALLHELDQLNEIERN